ncbi:RHS repeat-associated core domain-containing protein [Rugosimonospora africana]|uniref:RHS repeat-associated core domain-containing protein n=1 Tax=Rugosimonospora africana TaxID=556532 RepID=UPI0019444ACC|nr:RHS repeat-associated core domain-containing protein [Rugosimonospora africana]
MAAVLASTPDIAAAQASRKHVPGAPPGMVNASVPGRGAPKVAAAADPDRSAPALVAPRYPAAASVTVSVPAAGAASPVKLGNLPATVAAPGGNTAAPTKVTARVLDHATTVKLGAGTAIALLLRRADGQTTRGRVRLTLDYSQFAQAYGGNYADRLRLVQIPASCASAPTAAQCSQGTPVTAVNNTTTQTMSVTVDASGGDTMIAMDSGASGETGDYRATDLNVAQKWTAGQPAGDFAYTYPIDLPDPPYGQAPSLSLDYDSGTVDGRTSRSNNQASWVGQGWDINVPYIEREYKSCADDGHSTWGDLCWASPYSGDPAAASYVISINGHTSELIKAADGSYRMKDDQSYRIEHHTGGPNGDNDGEFWEVSTLDGTQYFFGYGQDQRRSTATPTNSNWTVPVVSDDSGEPCHQSDLASCQQTYRWNVDEVHSPNEVYQVYFYNTETNSYKRTSSGNILSYIRGGYLAKIEYGKVWAADAPAPAYVTFQNYNRCTQRVAIDDPDTTPEPTCPTQADSPKSYPDVPTELLCSTSCSKHSPTFFVSDMLDNIQAYVQNTSGGYDEVTKWQLKHSYPATDDGTNASLWLDYVREIGYTGGTVRDAVASFDGTNYNNRVDYNTSLGVPPLSMRRLTAIHNSYGGETDIVYGHQNGCFTGGTSAPGWTSWYNTKNGHWDTNTDECYPEYFKPDGADPGWGIFHKYVVKSVTDVDKVAGQPSRVSTYTYLGGAAWHHDDGMLTPDDESSYGDWRGYSTVRVTEGSGSNGEKTVTDTTYFRGMDQNVQVDGTNKSYSLVDYDKHSYPDSHFLQGMELQQQKYRMNADGSLTEVSGERFTYKDVLGITADGPGLHNAHVVRRDSHLTRDLLDNGTYRVTEIDDTYDTYGSVTTETDKGDTSVSTDDVCTTTTYARNTTDWRWMIDFPETVEKRQGSCTGGVIGRTVTLYDGATSTGATANVPIDGNPTEVRSYVNDTTYSAMDKTYDDEGRVLTQTDPLHHTTTTVYDPATGYPTNGVTVINPLGQRTTTWTSPALGEITKVADANGHDANGQLNGKVTERDYDALGRVTAIWLPTEPRSSGTPSYSFSYTTPASGIAPATGPTIITTRQLQSGGGSGAVWLTSYEYDDGFAEPVETQTASPQSGGRAVTVTRYDSRGLKALESQPFYNSSAPGSGLLNPAESAIPNYTTTVYDSLEQKTVEATKSLGTELWRTTTTDHGDHTVSVPPAGGQMVTWTDVFDNATKVQNYLDTTNHQDITYAYTPDHQDLASVTDANGDVTSYTYDWLHHRLTEADPDSGPGTTAYDLAGNVVATTDAKGQKVSTGYDALDRKTSTWLGDIGTGTQLTAMTYDTVPNAIGEPATSTRYAGGQTYVNAVTSYDARYRVTGRRYTIPLTETGLGGSYDFSYAYDGADHQTSVTYPAAGGLPQETVTEQYTNIGLPNTLSSPVATYVAGTSFAGDGKLAGRQYSSTLARQYTYQPTTARLSTIKTLVNGATVQNDEYGYDQVGNVTTITDHVANQAQCFNYDGRDRLTGAYTNGTDCTHPADTSGPAPYNLAYSYDGAGNITSTTRDGATTTYAYPAQGTSAVRPHAVSAVGADSFGYDPNGDLVTKTVAGVANTLTWNVNNQLASITASGKTASFIYDTDGDRLLRRDPGSTTLFLDDTELTSTGGEAPVATRYYSSGSDGAVVAERTPAAMTWLVADDQGSQQLAISTTGTVSRQLYLPYGAPRGAANKIPGDRGFLGKVQDTSTGLDLLDARYYDPSIGRFLSPDPVDNNDKPTDANPYAYAGDNPVTFSDPNGLMTTCPSGHGVCGVPRPSSSSHHSSGHSSSHSSGHHSSSRYYGHITSHVSRGNDCLIPGFFCGYRPPPPCLTQAFFCGTESMAHTVTTKHKAGKHWWQKVLPHVLPTISVAAALLALSPFCPVVCLGISVAADTLQTAIDLAQGKFLKAAWDGAGAASFFGAKYIRAGRAAADLAYAGEAGKGGQEAVRMALHAKYGPAHGAAMMSQKSARVARWTAVQLAHAPVDRYLTYQGIGWNILSETFSYAGWS